LSDFPCEEKEEEEERKKEFFSLLRRGGFFFSDNGKRKKKRGEAVNGALPKEGGEGKRKESISLPPDMEGGVGEDSLRSLRWKDKK